MNMPRENYVCGTIWQNGKRKHKFGCPMRQVNNFAFKKSDKS